MDTQKSNHCSYFLAIFGGLTICAIAAAIFVHDYLITSLLLVVPIEMMVWLFIQRPEERELNLLERRLEGYAALKNNNSCNQRASAALRFEVLLGILKKIEMKAAALLTVWAIMLAISISVAGGDPRLSAASVSAAAMPMFALVRVFSQVDNEDIRYCAVEGVEISNLLECRLKKDAIEKEASFRFAYCVTLGFLFFALVISIVLLLACWQKLEAKNSPQSFGIFLR